MYKYLDGGKAALFYDFRDTVGGYVLFDEEVDSDFVEVLLNIESAEDMDAAERLFGTWDYSRAFGQPLFRLEENNFSFQKYKQDGQV